jgi:hypothetical protein
MVIPVIILGFLGGKSWRPLSRWTALCVGGVGAILWLISVSPQCLAGPYAEVPDQAHQIWLIQITEVQGFLEVVGRSPAFALSMALAPVAAILFVGREVLVSRRSEYLPLLLGLLVAIGLAVWQVRMVPLTAALAAPIIAVIALRLRERFSWEMGRAAAPVLVVLLLSGIVTTFFEEATRAETGGSEVVGACVNGRLLEGLRAHGPDLVLAEIDLGPTLLVHTDHSVLASPYHRAFEGVLASYDILVGDIEEAEQRVNAAQVSYVVVCDGTAWAGNWAADNPDGLFSRLLSDNPPDWLAKVVDAGRSRVYSVK